MCSALVIADGHNGPVIHASSPSGFTIYGDQAPLLRRGIQAHAEQEQIVSIIDCGDQNTYERPGEDFSEYRRSTTNIMNKFNGRYYVLNDNHSIDRTTGQYRKARKTTLITDLPGFEETSTLLMQPQFMGYPHDPHFTYEEEEILDHLTMVTTPNLLGFSHFSLLNNDPRNVNTNVFNPKLRGPFDRVAHELKQMVEKGKRILLTNGHGHYFALSSEEQRLRQLEMVSFTQEDLENKGKACGLFNTITEAQGKLSINFKKITMNLGFPDHVSPGPLCYKVDDVEENHMWQYERRDYIDPARRRGLG